MSNSIWKTDNLQEADIRKQVLFYAGGSCFPYLGWHYPQKGFGTWDYKDIQKWAYLEDVLVQADKAERLQEAVDLAVNVLEEIIQDESDEWFYIAKNAIEQIKHKE